MSLPFGFSPFDDDYDSPYASTNAAIRRQSKGAAQLQQTTPTSSLSGAQGPSQSQSQQQQQQHQASSAAQSRSPTRPSSRRESQVGDAFPEMSARRYSPPPAIPAAEDFGSKRFGSSRSPSAGASDMRPITQPQPMGAPLAAVFADEQEPAKVQSPTASPPVSPPASPSQRRRPPPPPAARAASPPAASKSTPPANSAPASPPAPPSSSSRWSWRRGAAAVPAATAATAATTAATQTPPAPASTPAAATTGTNTPAPAPQLHDLPEPAAPPAPSQVALATPAEDGEQPAGTGAAATAATTTAPSEVQEMREIGGGNNNEESAPGSPLSPVTSSLGGAHSDDYPHDAPSPREEMPPSRSSFQSTHSRSAGAGAAALGAGGVTAAAAAAAASRPDHTAYNMGDYSSSASPFNEKIAPGSAAAGASTLPIAAHAKRNNEGSRFSQANSYSAAGGAGAGAGAGGALSRSWRNHKKAWVIGGIIALIVIIAAAVGGAVGANSSSSGGSGSGSSKGTTNGGGNGSDKGTGSGGTGIKADSRLHNSFYGINYTPFESLAPSCGANLTGIIDDLKLVSQLTTRVRLSGSACNETAMVLDAIQRLDIDLTVYPSIAVTDSTTLTSSAWTNQVNLVIDAMTQFGTTHIGGVQVGDDYITNIGSQADLLRFIQAFRTALTGSSALSGVLVGTAEASSTWSASLMESVDFVFANNQAWYSGLDIDTAAGWTGSYFASTVGDMLDDASNNPPAYISETGWPSGAFATSQATLDDAVASVANLQTYLDTFVCQANSNGTGYFYFEMFDDPNLRTAAGGVGGYWGLFDTDKNLKDITIPSCSHR